MDDGNILNYFHNLMSPLSALKDPIAEEILVEEWSSLDLLLVVVKLLVMVEPVLPIVLKRRVDCT